MSRSQLACAIDAGTTTVVRVKSTSPSSYAVTSCRSLNAGLGEFTGARRGRTIRRLAASMKEWRGEPLAIAFSPHEFLTLPTWMPEGSSAGERAALERMEAGFFLRNTDEWACHAAPIDGSGQTHEGLEKRLLMFYPSEPAQQIEEELGKLHPVGMRGLHVEALAILSKGLGNPVPVLELENGYASFSISRNGRLEYFRHWPVRDAGEREYFAMTELSASAIAKEVPVRVTGLAADPASVRRIGREASCPMEPLGVPGNVQTGRVVPASPTPSVVRAIAMALLALQHA